MLTFCSIGSFFFRSKYVCFGSHGNIFMFVYFFDLKVGNDTECMKKRGERKEKMINFYNL